MNQAMLIVHECCHKIHNMNCSYREMFNNNKINEHYHNLRNFFSSAHYVSEYTIQHKSTGRTSITSIQFDETHLLVFPLNFKFVG